MENNTNSPYDNNLPIGELHDPLCKGTTGPIPNEFNPKIDVATSIPLDGNTGGISITEVSESVIIETPLSTQDILLNDSRISPTGNGNPASKPYCTQPTSGQKWWAAVLLGFVFALVSSPAAYYVSTKITTSLGGISTIEGTGPNFVGLLIHTLVFIIIVRIILW